MESLVDFVKVDKVLDKGEIKKGLFTLLDRYAEAAGLHVPSGATIFVKPNICYLRGAETGATVNPCVVEFLIEWLNENQRPGSIVVGESDATELDVERAYDFLGWRYLEERFKNVRLVNLSRDERMKVELKGLYFDVLEMPRSYMQADLLISVAKLKTHVLTKMTGVLKNQYGAYPEKYKARFHGSVDKVICDLNKVKLPDLCLVDGLIGMEGRGPVDGPPKPMGLLLCGNDPVAIDHACARIMGIDPGDVRHLKMALEQGLGSFEYRVLSDGLESVRSSFACGTPLWKKTLYQSYITLKQIPYLRDILGRVVR